MFLKHFSLLLNCLDILLICVSEAIFAKINSVALIHKDMICTLKLNPLSPVRFVWCPEFKETRDLWLIIYCTSHISTLRAANYLVRQRLHLLFLWIINVPHLCYLLGVRKKGHIHTIYCRLCNRIQRWHDLLTDLHQCKVSEGVVCLCAKPHPLWH